ncbi:hypothetical protein RvY_02140 [Ramazzottius varieornatus]|uniref:Uncharacterized protein n=1 Tax=Ramazzottius varieornatus TaxID=947166 RepID=A0A1D1UTU8_RAMVA|nr:hypothetical protein RvY_02140 [Ramazzottius varieornatus]
MADEIVIRRRALNSLVVHLADPLHIHESLDRGVIKVLGFRLQEEDYLVRERATACLQLITRKGHRVEEKLLCVVVLWASSKSVSVTKRMLFG